MASEALEDIAQFYHLKKKKLVHVSHNRSLLLYGREQDRTRTSYFGHLSLCWLLSVV